MPFDCPIWSDAVSRAEAGGAQGVRVDRQPWEIMVTPYVKRGCQELRTQCQDETGGYAILIGTVSR